MPIWFLLSSPDVLVYTCNSYTISSLPNYLATSQKFILLRRRCRHRWSFVVAAIDTTAATAADTAIIVIAIDVAVVVYLFNYSLVWRSTSSLSRCAKLSE